MVAGYVPASRTLDLNLPSPEAIAVLLGGGRVEIVGFEATTATWFHGTGRLT